MDDLERFGDIDWTDFSTLLFPEHSISPTRDSQEHTHGVGELTLDENTAISDDFMTNDSGGHHETLSNSLNIQAFPATLLYENFSDDIDQDPPHIQGPLHAASQETEEYEWRPDDTPNADFQFPYQPQINYAVPEQPHQVANDVSINPVLLPQNGYQMNEIVLLGTSEQHVTSNICTVNAADDSRAFVFRCMVPRCRRRNFGRWNDFNRHYNGAHAVQKTVFWCPVDGCDRSENGGDRPFPRKDKMMTHALKRHGRGDGDHNQVIGMDG